jgi:hypothetical protein
VKYQLVHHDGTNFDVVESSPVLNDEASRNNWYNDAIARNQLPEGRQWGIIQPGHPWYREDAENKPNDSAPPTPTAEAVSSTEVKDVNSEPSFAEVMQHEQQQWNQRRKEEIEEREALAVVLRNFNNRRK